MKNHRFTVCERDNNNKTPKGKQLQDCNICLCSFALQICTLCVYICICTHIQRYLKTSLLNLLSDTVKRREYTVIPCAVHIFQLLNINMTSASDLVALVLKQCKTCCQNYLPKFGSSSRSRFWRCRSSNNQERYFFVWYIQQELA